MANALGLLGIQGIGMAVPAWILDTLKQRAGNPGGCGTAWWAGSFQAAG